MSAAPLEQAITAVRPVLANVSKEQLDDPTPCAKWKVRELVNHIVGGQYFFATMAKGEAMQGDAPDFASGDFVAAFDEGAKQSVAAFNEPGVMQKTLNLPFGQMPGAAFVGIAATDTLTHAWDLAKATGQSTDIAPELSAQLLAASRQFIQEAFRNEEGTVFGPEQTAPAGSTNADQLAAFLGRKV